MNYAAEYETWLGKFGPRLVVAEKGPGARRPPVRESLLRCLWYEQLVIPKLLQTEDHQQVHVEFPGFWNLGPGPDFSKARLRIGDRRLTGDVEVHLDTSGWADHAHDRDPRYANVILHVALWRGGAERSDPRTVHGDPVPEVILEPCLARPLEELLTEVDADRYPAEAPTSLGLCHPYASQAAENRSAVVSWVLRASDARFEAKIQRALGWLNRSAAPAHAFSFFWMETWGFGGFREAFQRAALACFETGLEGLVSGPVEDAEARLEKFLMDRLRSAEGKTVASRPRPAASIPRRVSALSHGLLSLLRDSQAWTALTEGIENACRQAAGRAVGKALAEAFDLMHPKVRACSLLGSSSSSSRAAAPGLGKDVRSILQLNACLPFAAAWARRRLKPKLERAMHDAYSTFPRLPANRVERVTARMIFGAGCAAWLASLPVASPERSARFQQGLHRLFEDFCSLGLEGCERCPVVRSLRAGEGHPA